MEQIVTTVITVLDGEELIVSHDLPVELDGVLTETIRIEANVQDLGTIEGPYGELVSRGDEFVNIRINGREVEKYTVSQVGPGATIHVTTVPKESA